MPDFDSLRQNMVNSQLRTNKVTDDRILLAMGKIPRESFAPARLAELAYIDEDIPIGSGRSMLEPMIFARMVQAANRDENDVVLDVASGAGYSSSSFSRGTWLRRRDMNSLRSVLTSPSIRTRETSMYTPISSKPRDS